MIAGVVGGLAEYLNVDATAARVAFVAASVLLMGVGGPLLYILAWAIVPEYGKETSIVSEALRDKPWQNWRPAQGV
jgi:phage shock protein PspC (stress-responsive transcriptional regulator)